MCPVSRGRLAQGMRDRGTPSMEAAHFFMKRMFCMFAKDIDLLPERLFPKLLSNTRNDPGKLASRLRSLFQAMARGGDFGVEAIQHFNGGLFAEAGVIELTPAEIEELTRVSGYDWSSVEPTIFGTLFERTLDPAKRSQIGAHYTSRDDILTLLEPVMMAPLRREWQAVEEKCEKLWVEVQEGAREASARKGKRSRSGFLLAAADKNLEWPGFPRCWLLARLYQAGLVTRRVSTKGFRDASYITSSFPKLLGAVNVPVPRFQCPFSLQSGSGCWWVSEHRSSPDRGPVHRWRSLVWITLDQEQPQYHSLQFLHLLS